MIFPRTSSFIALATLSVALSCSALHAQLAAKINLKDNKTLSGDIINWTPTQITVKENDLGKPVTIDTEGITKIDLKHKPQPKNNGKRSNISTVKIKSRFNASEHEVLVGNFTKIDDKYITLKTLYAGEVKIKREFIHSMEIQPFSEAIYSGPNNLEEWNNTLHTKSWEFKNNALICGKDIGNIAKDINLPELAHIQFDHQWKERVAVSLYFYSSSAKISHPNRYYELHFQHGALSIRKYNEGKATVLRPKDPKNIERYTLERRLRELGKAKYDLFLDKKKGLFHVLVNGKVYATYIDRKPQPDLYGSAIHFANRQNNPIRISNIKISKWSGYLNNEAENEPEIFKQEGNSVTLKNGDKIIGKINDINDGVMTVQTPVTRVKVPVKVIRLLDFSKTKKAQPYSYSEDVKIWLNASQFIIIKFISLNGLKLKGYHQALGEVEFNLNHINTISYRAYTENSKSTNW